MKYAVQVHTGAYFLVVHGERGPELRSYSSCADLGVRILTFDSKEEAEHQIPELLKSMGVNGKYEVITVGQ